MATRQHKTSRAPAIFGLILLTGAGVYGAGHLLGGIFGGDEVTSAEHFSNRVWLERMPTDDRDLISHFVALETSDGRFGVVGRSSTWRHFLEVFKWRREGERLTLFFPQEHSRSDLAIRTWECRGEAPRPFELCLEFKRGDRSVVFYSRYDLVIDPHSLEAGDTASFVTEHPELGALARGWATAPVDALAGLADAPPWTAEAPLASLPWTPARGER